MNEEQFRQRAHDQGCYIELHGLAAKGRISVALVLALVPAQAVIGLAYLVAKV